MTGRRTWLTTCRGLELLVSAAGTESSDEALEADELTDTMVLLSGAA